MFDQWNKLSDDHKGIILTALGTVLLLHTLGVFTTGLKYILYILSIGMIGIGLVKLNAWQRISQYINKK